MVILYCLETQNNKKHLCVRYRHKSFYFDPQLGEFSSSYHIWKLTVQFPYSPLLAMFACHFLGVVLEG
jgi:hypothetical protein